MEGNDTRRGCVEIVCGSMFSGKTEELLRRIKRARLGRQRVQLFKPRVDDRYDAVKVVSHEGMNADAMPVSNAVNPIEVWKNSGMMSEVP